MLGKSGGTPIGCSAQEILLILKRKEEDFFKKTLELFKYNSFE